MTRPEGALKTVAEVEKLVDKGPPGIIYCVWSPGGETMFVAIELRKSSVLNEGKRYVENVKTKVLFSTLMCGDGLSLEHVHLDVREGDQLGYLFDNYWLAWAYYLRCTNQKAA